MVQVGVVYEMLKATSHNGFPVITKDKHLRGFILRKTLCALLKHKAFSVPDSKRKEEVGANQLLLAPAATLFYDTLERNYPRFTKINEIALTPTEMVCIRTVQYYSIMH